MPKQAPSPAESARDEACVQNSSPRYHSACRPKRPLVRVPGKSGNTPAGNGALPSALTAPARRLRTAAGRGMTRRGQQRRLAPTGGSLQLLFPQGGPCCVPGKPGLFAFVLCIKIPPAAAFVKGQIAFTGPVCYNQTNLSAEKKGLCARHFPACPPPGGAAFFREV